MNDDIQTHPLAEAFHKMTPEDVLDAVEAATGRRFSGRFIILNSYENRVWQLELEEGGWLVGKFYRPGRWSKETILAEHELLAELEEAEIPVALPLSLARGGTLAEVHGIMFSMSPRIGGRSPQELDDEQLRILGRLLGRIHNVGASRGTSHRMTLSPKTYGEDNLRRLLTLGVIPPEARDIYAETVAMLIARIEPMFLGVPMHRIHGDCHLGNVLWSTSTPTFLDFDDMLIGPAVQDVWLLVPSYDEYGQAQRETLLEAYSQMRGFDHTWLRLVEPLRALRYIHYSTWIARRWEDPIFRRMFAHFGTLLYWQNEIQDLREQIARIDEGPLYN
jgi:Ser/Thr protein kinase RdoA (MazF antagonist)